MGKEIALQLVILPGLFLLYIVYKPKRLATAARAHLPTDGLDHYRLGLPTIHLINLTVQPLLYED